jgi:hypothetical protein
MGYQNDLVLFSVLRMAAGSTTTTVGRNRYVILAPNGVARVQR